MSVVYDLADVTGNISEQFTLVRQTLEDMSIEYDISDDGDAFRIAMESCRANWTTVIVLTSDRDRLHLITELYLNVEAEHRETVCALLNHKNWQLEDSAYLYDEEGSRIFLRQTVYGVSRQDSESLSDHLLSGWATVFDDTPMFSVFARRPADIIEEVRVTH